MGKFQLPNRAHISKHIEVKNPEKQKGASSQTSTFDTYIKYISQTL